MNNIPVITVDGPAGSGKGTLCHLLAWHLGWHRLDSGATYRLLALAVVQRGIDTENEAQVAALIPTLEMRFSEDANGESHVYLDGQEVTRAIREESCGQLASRLAAFPEVRAGMLDKQRNFRKTPGLVTDGRDMGTVVFPEATVKIFLIASSEERARRRYEQLKGQGIDANLPRILEELQARDERDTTRATAPLKPASDAFVLDSSGVSIEVVFEEALEIISSKIR